MNQQIQNMTVGFTDAILWASCCTTPDGIEYESFDGIEFPNGKLASECLSAEAAAFIESTCHMWHCRAESFMGGAFTKWLDNAGHNPGSPTDWQYVGHTLYLALSGSGVTFTDSDSSDKAEKLADACRLGYFPSPYTGDDWLIYLA